jgi:hypothetical protein
MHISALYKQLYARFDSVTPLKGVDCGRLCGAACCESEGDEAAGMYLFPGEAALFKGKKGFSIVLSDFEAEGKAVKLLICERACDRRDRPLACRVFPLIPRAAEGGFEIVVDPRARALCPLASAPEWIDPRFWKTAEKAARVLTRFAPLRAYLRALTEILKEYERFYG